MEPTTEPKARLKHAVDSGLRDQWVTEVDTSVDTKKPPCPGATQWCMRHQWSKPGAHPSKPVKARESDLTTHFHWALAIKGSSQWAAKSRVSSHCLDHVCVLMHSEARFRRGLDCLLSELRDHLLQESSGKSGYEAREAWSSPDIQPIRTPAWQQPSSQIRQSTWGDQGSPHGHRYAAHGREIGRCISPDRPQRERYKRQSLQDLWLIRRCSNSPWTSEFLQCPLDGPRFTKRLQHFMGRQSSDMAPCVITSWLKAADTKTLAVQVWKMDDQVHLGIHASPSLIKQSQQRQVSRRWSRLPSEKFDTVGTAAIDRWTSSKTNWNSAKQRKDDAIEAVPKGMNHNEDLYSALSNLKYPRDKSWETLESNRCT